MNIQLTQQTLACFTALLLNILYPHACLHVFMNSREQRCWLKSLLKQRLKYPGRGGQEAAKVHSQKSRGWSDCRGPETGLSDFTPQEREGGPEKVKTGPEVTQATRGTDRTWSSLVVPAALFWQRSLGSHGI